MRYYKYTNKLPWGISVTLIAKDGKSSVNIGFFNEKEDEGFISNLLVHPSVRRRGRARDILSEAEVEIKKKGRNCACLEVINHGWLYRWYVKNGYLATGYIYDSKYIEMKKNLGNKVN